MAKYIPKIVKDIIRNKPEVDYALKKHVSFSQLSIYESCKHRWKLQYKDKIKKFNSSIHTVFGTAMHEVIQEYLDVFYNKSKVAANKIDLADLFQEKYIDEYQKQYKANKSAHFSDAVEMREFYNDGVAILEEFKKRVGGFFSKRGTYLVGCEVNLDLAPIKSLNKIHYTGFLDVVLYNERSDTFTIIDIKTSTRGWNDKAKKDNMKKFQLVLYKKYFSEQYNIPMDKIDVKFLILKRKIYENTDYVMRRLTEFKPASGRNTIAAATRTMNNFITEVFNHDGSIKENKYPKSVSKWNCLFCPYAEDSNLCGQGVHFS